jgi:hypothetical protein
MLVKAQPTYFVMLRNKKTKNSLTFNRHLISCSEKDIVFLIQCHHMSIMDFMVSLPAVAEV